MTCTKEVVNELLTKWGITSNPLRKFISQSKPETRFELLGWVKVKKDENVDEKEILKQLRTAAKQWDSDLYLARKDEVTLIIKNMINPPDVEEGAYKCRKCGSERTVSISKQLLSSDEPMTNFITCIGCNNHWKE